MAEFDTVESADVRDHEDYVYHELTPLFLHAYANLVAASPVKGREMRHEAVVCLHMHSTSRQSSPPHIHAMAVLTMDTVLTSFCVQLRQLDFRHAIEAEVLSHLAYSEIPRAAPGTAGFTVVMARFSNARRDMQAAVRAME
jgi:hypothetical protein